MRDILIILFWIIGVAVPLLGGLVALCWSFFLWSIGVL